jgi:site-specific recombinase XerD
MMTVGSLVYQFFEHHLKAERGLSQASIRSYRDGIRLFLLFMAKTAGHPISKLALSDLSADNVRAFLTYLEAERGNNIRSRNHRLAMLHTFFGFVGGQAPELLHEAERVAAIPRKRTQPPATRYLERDEVEELFASLPRDGRLATRDKALLLFLYNTGARAAEVVGLTIGQLVLAPPPRVNLHGKGGKWRTCPLWPETARVIDAMLRSRRQSAAPSSPVFLSTGGRPLTRFGLYKLVRRHTISVPTGENQRAVSPHVFRHTTAVHLLESGVDVNVIRGWLGHVSLDTTNRYAEINIRMKQEALEACQLPSTSSVGPPRRPVWQSEPKLLEWLACPLIDMWPVAVTATAIRGGSPRNRGGHKSTTIRSWRWPASWAMGRGSGRECSASCNPITCLPTGSGVRVRGTTRARSKGWSAGSAGTCWCRYRGRRASRR